MVIVSRVKAAPISPKAIVPILYIVNPAYVGVNVARWIQNCRKPQCGKLTVGNRRWDWDSNPGGLRHLLSRQAQ